MLRNDQILTTAVAEGYSSEEDFDEDEVDDAGLKEIILDERKLYDEDDEVWHEPQRAGIEVVINFKQGQGWRDEWE
jgi:hypothetical protein